MQADRANRVWTADFKGQFRLGNGAFCYPLAVADAYGRYLVVCRARTLKEEVAHPPRHSPAVAAAGIGPLPAELQRRATSPRAPSADACGSLHAVARPYPADLPEVTYPAHFEVRRVSKIGVVNWKKKRTFVSTALANEPLGFEHIAADVWSVFLGQILLGRIQEGETRLAIGSGR